MNKELEMLVESMPPAGDDEAAWAEFEAALLGKRPDCPFSADLIELALGQADPASAAKLHQHLEGCTYCRTCFEAYQQAAEPDSEPTAPATEGSFLEQFSVGLTATELLPNGPEESKPVEAAPPRQQPEPSAEGAPSGMTTLMDAGRWQELTDHLRPYLPAVLQTVGLDTTLADRLLMFIGQTARTSAKQGRRFRDLLPDWLAAFAQTCGLKELPRPLRREDWESIIERSALRLVLEEEPAGEPDWAREFRRLARQEAAGSREDLLRIRLPEKYAQASALPVFRRQLLFRVQQEREKAAQLLELN
jgi:hypothetical protein